MKQPDFIIGGATRSGIQTLSQILDHHPQIYMPHRKEHQFFHQEKIMRRAPDSTKTHFEDAVHVEYKTQIPKNRILHGEEEFDPARAHQGAPHAKVIFTLTNPVERAYAQFQHALEHKKETVRTFEEAIAEELSGKRTPETTGRCWLYKNQYQTHIEEWVKYYSRKKICLFIYEEWADAEYKGLRPVESFLGLAQDSLTLEIDLNVPDQKLRLLDSLKERMTRYPPLNEDTKAQIEDILSIDKMYISNFLGRPIPAWQN